MAIYIVQHGRCVTKEVDPDRPLLSEGRTEVERIAGVAAGYGICPSVIYHSGKTRARETASIYGKALGAGVSEMAGMNPMDDVERFAARVDSQSQAMFVGHLPFLERLVAFLITGNLDIPVFKLQNGGVLCMDKDSDTGRWSIRWGLMPNVGP